ncbi:hypothetical protein HU830_05410 [Lactobacillus sp. DCY120]|uniref:Uncharacterized protein n=1 Tax=Bombilactobacillus apium TaxID=2675299 RepID=A0A850RCV5_9LACO|nr:hypothetical protein [Bombilactobacillus apium]NVY96598.1 hypothetical protein [Bombilactobacillus apium]
MNTVISRFVVGYQLSGFSKELKKIIPISIVSVLVVSLFIHSALLASALGVSVGRAAAIAQAAYDAWRAGQSIRAAVGAAAGAGLVGIAVSFILGWGVNRVLGSAWLKGM